jgi:hypothetical protein
MTDQALHWAKLRAARPLPTGSGALLLGSAIFGLLWTVNTLYRRVYVPGGSDITALADGLLLAPGAHWVDWFTRGDSHFLDRYPEWPPGDTAFTRPIFHFVIYLTHFGLGRDWASYQIINCFAAAGVAAIAFVIARTALELRTGSSLLAGVLVTASPPVLESWLRGLGFAIEPLATLLVAGAFLAAVARRDFLCLVFLFMALLTKENAVWAPVAAAITIMLRGKPGEPLRRRTFTSAAMLSPVVVWLALRFALFGGVSGTYATEGYTPLADFLSLTFYKLEGVDALFVSRHAFVTEGGWALLDRATRIGTRLLIYALLCLYTLRILPETVKHVCSAMREKRWPIMDPTVLVGLWAAIALAFHFALPLPGERYATSVIVFGWPALVAEVERRRKAIIFLGLGVCCVVSLARSSYASIVRITNEANYMRNNNSSMDAALRQVPMTIRQVYVLPTDGLHDANPEYVRLVLGVTAEIVLLADIDWRCGEAKGLVAFDHSTVDGFVNLTITLPACANFNFYMAQKHLDGTALRNGRLYRNDRISYELPEAYPISPKKGGAAFDFGRKMTVHVRPNGPARFIIQHSGPEGIAWFDSP